ncbi:Ala-tRNA(Pro) hydrolase [Brevirhabdus pacifica]|uniref:Ala-tRNA(Pro) hydrolase n=1 Tax=Brevirhabdus pacifica TaxID=1267768 RepID=A0A1U7DFU9_9RHOB|nr:alanyl-tRNA editing protein [Brevirhabdus pacifica]APX88758.1 Ala-tRNA(Pro) hydrolase [Brevirhabdus pacifica]OWU80013.1 Ala-tRNA(Pro) hydrolase [Loktanella sp. 22II-4b]PJJ86718.1 misacylated tRNA(Ala) deacylase [Brevirhabdus pacifica]
MTRMLYREDAYLTEAPGTVVAHTEEGGLVLDQSLFYPTGGGQPGDSGTLLVAGARRLPIATAVRGTDGRIVLVPAEPVTLPPVGTELVQRLDWDRRFRHMRVHTALHLLSVLIPLPVTGGAIGAAKGRLDFDMPDGETDRDGLEAALNELIDQDHPVSERWITDAELAAQPELVKTMSVRPPTGAGRVRLIHIGEEDDQIDLQPCGGTHVARLGEIGGIRVGKVENKGRRNRRVNIHLDT